VYGAGFIITHHRFRVSSDCAPPAMTFIIAPLLLLLLLLARLRRCHVTLFVSRGYYKLQHHATVTS